MNTQAPRSVVFHPTAISSDGYRLAEGMPIKTHPTAVRDSHGSRHWGRGRVHGFKNKNVCLVIRPRKDPEEIKLEHIKLDKSSCVEEGYPMVKAPAVIAPVHDTPKKTIPSEADRLVQQLKLAGYSPITPQTRPVEEEKVQVGPQKPTVATGSLLAGSGLRYSPGQEILTDGLAGRSSGALAGGLDVPGADNAIKVSSSDGKAAAAIKDMTTDGKGRPVQVRTRAKGRGDDGHLERLAEELEEIVAGEDGGASELGNGDLKGQNVLSSTSLPHGNGLIHTPEPRTSVSPPADPINQATGFDFDAIHGVLLQARTAAAVKLNQLLADREAARTLLAEAEEAVKQLEKQLQQLGFNVTEIYNQRHQVK